MTIYEDVVFSPEVVSDIAEISRFIRAKNTKEAANKYIDLLEAEINSLAIWADFIPKSKFWAHRQYHPEAKRLLTKNRKWNVVFHTEGRRVIIDKIIPSKMVTE